MVQPEPLGHQAQTARMAPTGRMVLMAPPERLGPRALPVLREKRVHKALVAKMVFVFHAPMERMVQLVRQEPLAPPEPQGQQAHLARMAPTARME